MSFLKNSSTIYKRFHSSEFDCISTKYSAITKAIEKNREDLDKMKEEVLKLSSIIVALKDIPPQFLEFSSRSFVDQRQITYRVRETWSWRG